MASNVQSAVFIPLLVLLIVEVKKYYVFCAEGGTDNNNIRDQFSNLAPGAGGYGGSSNINTNYDYILDDTPPRGTYYFWHN